jgi:hypothetical protein
MSDGHDTPNDILEDLRIDLSGLLHSFALPVQLPNEVIVPQLFQGANDQKPALTLLAQSLCLENQIWLIKLLTERRPS